MTPAVTADQMATEEDQGNTPGAAPMDMVAGAARTATARAIAAQDTVADAPVEVPSAWSSWPPSKKAPTTATAS